MQFGIILKKRYYYFYIWILYFFLFSLVYLSIIPVEFYFKDDYSHFFGNDDLKEITISAASIATNTAAFIPDWAFWDFICFTF